MFTFIVFTYRRNKNIVTKILLKTKLKEKSVRGVSCSFFSIETYVLERATSFNFKL